MSLHSTEAYVGSRRTVFLGAEDLHYEFVLWTGGEGESERTPRLAKNNDERVAAAAIVSPPRHYSESISWVGPPVQRGLVFTLGMPVMIAPGTFLQYPSHICAGRKTTAQHR